MTLQDEPAQSRPTGSRARGGGAAAPKALTIGARLQGARAGVPGHLDLQDPLPRGPEALAPRRTPGGYRLYSAGDVARLRTILRLQRDEFLPLRVIRQELAAGRTETDVAAPTGGADRRRRGAAQRRAERHRAEHRARCTRSTTSSRRPRADPRLVAELEDYGVIKGENRAGVEVLRRDRARDRPRGHRARPLRRRRAQPARRSAPRPTARRRCCSRSSPRRCARATRSAARRRSRRSRTSPRSTTHLKHLLLVRDLRKIVG